jgi:hypothetical protein
VNAAARLGLYGAGVAIAFAGAFGMGALVVPDGAITSWQDAAAQAHSDDGHSAAEENTMNHTTAVAGTAISAGGYVLAPVDAPPAVGADGELSFQILNSDGQPLVDYETAHEKDLHLIVVRTDGTEFRHVHPTLDTSSGTWSTPWTWMRAGTYRVYADFVPRVADGPDKVTLTRSVDVAGDFVPAPAAAERTTDSVDGFDVSIDGDLTAGASSEVTLTISRDGAPVTTLEPYLGAFGHLVALRDGDLAYLHVHAEGDEPEAGETAGPTITFLAEAPTAGRYLLYLDFQVAGQVHTATFVLDAAPGDGQTSDTHDGH